MTPSMMRGLAESLRSERMPHTAEQVEEAAATIERQHQRILQLEDALRLYVRGDDLVYGTGHTERSTIGRAVLESPPSPSGEPK